MQNRRKLTSSFRRIFRKNVGQQEKELFARWFSQLDVSSGPIFRDEAEEQDIGKRIAQNLHDHFFHQPAPVKIFRLPAWLPAAAVASVLLIIGSVWWFTSSKKHVQPTFATAITHAGERDIITLPDGSRITLNNASQLKFPSTFTDTLREVFLDGEAFFEIAPDDKKPFIVRAGKLNIQVLGTSFNVRHYAADQQIAVVVATGKVGVQGEDKSKTWMLTPGHQLNYDAVTQKVEESIVNTADYTAWQQGQLVFNNERLEEICKQLERWYNVKITIKTPALKGKRISLKPKKANLNTVLKTLGIVGEFDYEIKGQTVQIW